jgi:hypothetical protein
MNSLYSWQTIKRTELLYIREFVYIMAESKPVSATTVEHLGTMARFFSYTWHFITTFSRPKDTLLDVWVWKMLYKIVLHFPSHVWLNFPPLFSHYNSCASCGPVHPAVR